jgi:hypothetical protein
LAWDSVKNRAALESALGEAETIVAVTSGALDTAFPSGADAAGGPVTLAVTDSQIVAFRKKLFGQFFESHPLSSVKTMGVEPLEMGSMRSEAIVIAFRDAPTWACLSVRRDPRERDAFVRALRERVQVES